MSQIHCQPREAMVLEAMSWIGTPYVHGARVKGAGCDCATLIAECLIAAGFAMREDLGVYSQDWFHHSEKHGNRYLVALRRHVTEKMESVASRNCKASPGDVVLVKAAGSKVWNHGGIITEWPMVVHAIAPMVEEIDAARHPMWAYQEIAIFTPGVKP